MITAVLGNTAEIESIKVLLKKNKEYLLQQATALQEVLTSSTKADAIIFCEGSRSNKQNIEDLEKLRGNLTAMFYAPHAKSIIGSTDKNSNGFFITAP